jgi:hypothetical protein
MSTPMLVQGVVIALVVGWSVLFALRRLLPVTSRRAQARLAGWFDRPALPAALRGLARRLQPTSSSGGSCADGCSSCGGCGTAKPAVVEAQPLVFRPRAKT